MTVHPTGTAAPAPQVPQTPQVVLHEQRLIINTEQVPVERVVLRRRITSHVRQVEVTVRREELEITREPLTATVQPGPPQPPLVLVLSEETPVVQLHTRAYERVTVRIDSVAGQQQVTGDLSYEKAELLQ